MTHIQSRPQNDRQFSNVITVTHNHFYQYSVQPVWIWYDKFGDQTKKQPPSEHAVKLIEDAQRHKARYAETVNVQHRIPHDTPNVYDATLRLMQAGVEFIYKGCIQFERDGVLYRAQPTLLEKRPGNSFLGAWHYTPVEVSIAGSYDSHDTYRLAFFAFILEQVQGKHPDEVFFVNNAHEKTSIVLDFRAITHSKIIMHDIIAIRRGIKPELTASGSAKSSPWWYAARKELSRQQDIRLIYKLDSRSVPALRIAGINTLHDFVHCDVTKLGKIPYSPPDKLKRHYLQAQALLNDEVIKIKTIELPNVPLNIYFDIEGSPHRGIDYLLGFWVSGDPHKKYAQSGYVRFYEQEDRYFLYFIAESPSQERDMWFSFTEWLTCLPSDYAVFHYANYEREHLETMASRYGRPAELAVFQSKMVDLQKVVAQSVIFPLLSYSIKDIAKSRFINFAWRHHKASGGQSVLWFDEWLYTGKRSVLNDIIDYNEDDVRATEALCVWLITLSQI